MNTENYYIFLNNALSNNLVYKMSKDDLDLLNKKFGAMDSEYLKDLKSIYNKLITSEISKIPLIKLYAERIKDNEKKKADLISFFTNNTLLHTIYCLPDINQTYLDYFNKQFDVINFLYDFSGPQILYKLNSVFKKTELQMPIIFLDDSTSFYLQEMTNNYEFNSILEILLTCSNNENEIIKNIATYMSRENRIYINQILKQRDISFICENGKILSPKVALRSQTTKLQKTF